MTRARKCPICRKPRVPEFAPFCSTRCRDRDLVNWLEEGYALPGPVQLECVMAVGKLTFSEPGAFPKFMANLTGLMQAGAGLVRQTR